MAQFSVTERIDASAVDIWALVGDFGNDSWTGVAIEVDGSGVGAVRRVAMPTGEVVERCTVFDAVGRTLSYAVLSGNPLATRDHVGTIRVVEVDPSACDLTWSATYEPIGVPDAVVAELEGFLRTCILVLRRHLALRLGPDVGTLVVPDDFDEPLPEEELAAFEGGIFPEATT